MSVDAWAALCCPKYFCSSLLYSIFTLETACDSKVESSCDAVAVMIHSDMKVI